MESKLAGGFDGLAQSGGRRFDEEDVTDERVFRRVVDEGVELDVFADPHEGEIADPTFRHHISTLFTPGTAVRG